MKRVLVYTLGCKVNQYESQAIKEQFKERGYEILNENIDVNADIYIINTCTVTNLSDKKSRQMMRRAKKNNRESLVVVAGCYAQTSSEEIEKIDEVDIIVGVNNKNNIVNLVEGHRKTSKAIEIQDLSHMTHFENMHISHMDNRSRAYIKIQEGCNQFCSYCIIPYARGSIRSRLLSDIILEAKDLVANGYKEIVITGINAALYGIENKEGSLLDVIEKINNIEGKFRIRLSSIEPAVITDDFMEKLMGFKKLCSHVHLSLQSGSQLILEKMNRKYSVDHYKEVVRKMRLKRPEMNITTDIIVGFPGESSKNFDETCEFVKLMRFGKVHVFKYSKRKGTKAAEMKNQVDSNSKNDRSHRLIEIANDSAQRFNSEFIGRTQEVLFENIDSKTGLAEGYTDNYIKVYVYGQEELIGNFRSVEIVENYRDGFKGYSSVNITIMAIYNQRKYGILFIGSYWVALK